MWLLHQQKSKAISFIYTYYVVMWQWHQQIHKGPLINCKALSFIYTYYVVMWQWHQQIHKGPLINCIHICYVAVASTV